MTQATATVLAALKTTSFVPVGATGRSMGRRHEQKGSETPRATGPKLVESDAAVPRPDPADYVELVRKVARRFGRGLPANVTQDDLVSAGFEGLVCAAKRFDPAQGQAFAKFAEFRIKGAMLDELRRMDIMSRGDRMLKNKLERAVTRLTASLGKPPGDEDLAEFLKVDVSAVREVRGRLCDARLVSVDPDLNHAANFSPLAPEVGSADPERLAIQRGLSARAREAVRGLEARERMVIEMYFFQGAKLREIATRIGTTDSRVCQIKRAALGKLRSELRD